MHLEVVLQVPAGSLCKLCRVWSLLWRKPIVNRLHAEDVASQLQDCEIEKDNLEYSPSKTVNRVVNQQGSSVCPELSSSAASCHSLALASV